MFVKQRKDIDRSALYFFKCPFELLHTDIADIRFLVQLVVDPKHCLLSVDLFTLKLYTYLMKKTIIF